jgi:arylsulfatase A-like enzyme
MFSQLVAIWFLCVEGAVGFNIIYVVVDDMGYNDIGYQSNDIRTPFLDLLSSSLTSSSYGVRLTNYYTHTVCTPSRASLFTGRYGHNLGLPGPLLANSLYGLTVNETIATVLRDNLNYDTHLIGKWHLGYAKDKYTPTRNGFDRFTGSFVGALGYNTKIATSKRTGVDLQNHTAAGQRDHFYTADHYTNFLTDQAISTINKHQQQEKEMKHNSHGGGGGKSKNLFLVVTYTAPHSPLESDPRCWAFPFIPHITDYNFCHDNLSEKITFMDMCAFSTSVLECYLCLDRSQ